MVWDVIAVTGRLSVLRRSHLVPVLVLQGPEPCDQGLSDLRIGWSAVEVRQLVRVLLQVVELPGVELTVEVDELVAIGADAVMRPDVVPAVLAEVEALIERSTVARNRSGVVTAASARVMAFATGTQRSCTPLHSMCLDSARRCMLLRSSPIRSIVQ